MVRYQRPFSRLRKRTQKQIVYVLIKKASYSALCAAVLFSLLAYMYREIIFLIVGICFFVLFGFFRFYQIIRRRELARYYTIEYLQKIDPYDFECYVIELLNRTGYKLRWVGGSGDEGIDGIGSNIRGKHIILQVKRYSDKNVIDTTKFREFIGTLAYHDVASGIYVTTGFVSAGVREMVRKHSKKEILILDKDDLMTLIRKVYG